MMKTSFHVSVLTLLACFVSSNVVVVAETSFHSCLVPGQCSQDTCDGCNGVSMSYTDNLLEGVGSGGPYSDMKLECHACQGSVFTFTDCTGMDYPLGSLWCRVALGCWASEFVFVNSDFGSAERNFMCDFTSSCFQVDIKAKDNSKVTVKCSLADACEGMRITVDASSEAQLISTNGGCNSVAPCVIYKALGASVTIGGDVGDQQNIVVIETTDPPFVTTTNVETTDFELMGSTTAMPSEKSTETSEFDDGTAEPSAVPTDASQSTVWDKDYTQPPKNTTAIVTTDFHSTGIQQLATTTTDDDQKGDSGDGNGSIMKDPLTIGLIVVIAVLCICGALGYCAFAHYKNSLLTHQMAAGNARNVVRAQEGEGHTTTTAVTEELTEVPGADAMPQQTDALFSGETPGGEVLSSELYSAKVEGELPGPGW